MSLSFDHTSSKRRQKKQSPKHNKQPEAYNTNNQYKEPLVQKKALMVPGRRTYSGATKFGKKICIVDSHLNRIKSNIFQKSVNGGQTYFNVLRGATSKRLNHYIPPTLHENHADVVFLHIGSNDTNNQTKDRIIYAQKLIQFCYNKPFISFNIS